MISLNKVPKRNKDIAYRIIDSEAVLISLKEIGAGEMIKVLNKTATQIWELINGKRSVADLIKEIICAYDGLSKTLEVDILDFLNELHENKFIYF